MKYRFMVYGFLRQLSSGNPGIKLKKKGREARKVPMYCGEDVKMSVEAIRSIESSREFEAFRWERWTKHGHDVVGYIDTQVGLIDIDKMFAQVEEEIKQG
jgi:hypothetical protein